jgi:hypothetical protein
MRWDILSLNGANQSVRLTTSGTCTVNLLVVDLMLHPEMGLSYGSKMTIIGASLATLYLQTRIRYVCVFLIYIS